MRTRLHPEKVSWEVVPPFQKGLDDHNRRAAEARKRQGKQKGVSEKVPLRKEERWK
jgi:hypothetical protein